MSAPPWQAEEAGLGALLARLWQSGGWDYRLTPEDSWQKAHGARPYPGASALAAYPTFGPLDAWLDDPHVTDVQLNGPGRELVTRRSGDSLDRGTRERWHPAWLHWLCAQLQARGSGCATATALRGTADATRPGRRTCLLRYEVALPPLCPHGPAITIRVLRPDEWSLAALVELGALTRPTAELLAGCVRAAVDILIVGPAGSGKTTLAQALLHVISDERLICIEDSPEIVSTSPHTVQLCAGVAEGTSFAELVRAALRMNPGRIVIGETRGAEAYAVLAAARNGYPVLTTVHGDSARHGLHNLIAMALESRETQAQPGVVYSTVNARPMVIVALSWQDGRRRVTEIVEVERQYSAAAPIVTVLYDVRDGPLAYRNPPSAHTQAQLAAARSLPEVL